MRKFLLTLMASLLSCSAASAFWPEAAASSLDIGVGYRTDRLSWKTYADPTASGSGYSSDYSDSDARGVSSHLKWKDLRIWQIEASGKYVTCDNLYFRAQGDYGWITQGHNRDRDFFTEPNGERREFSNSHSRTRGHVYDADLAVGYEFKFCDDSFGLSPLVGYSWNGQHLRDHHLQQSLVADSSSSNVARSNSSSSYSNGSGSGSGSGDEHGRYNARWNGPFIGFDALYRFYCDWEFFLTYEYHWARYHANGRWGLREDLPHGFHHRVKNAYGNVVDVGVKWDFCECWTLSLKGEFQYYTGKHGRDRAKISNESVGTMRTECFASQSLRHLKWNSQTVALDLGMVF